MQSTTDTRQRTSASWLAPSLHSHCALAYTPRAPRITSWGPDYERNLVNFLFRTPDQQRRTLFQMNWNLQQLLTVSSDNWRHTILTLSLIL